MPCNSFRMLRIILLISFCCFFVLTGQELTHWVIELQVPANTPENADIYIAGNFNGWDPGNENYKFSDRGDKLYYLDLYIPQGKVRFKFTLGDWSLVEVDTNGYDINNREEFLIDGQMKNKYSVEEWKVPNHTQSIVGDVRVIEDFNIPQLNRQRRIWIYLPPGYESSKKRYPVLYMHDGQNLFSDSTSFSGEWGIDETLERMIAHKEIRPMIVVAVDNSKYRLSEYSPFDFEYKGIHKGEAAYYAQFIVETLKPYIDENFRTKRGRKYTAVSGSSMGGLLSVYMAVKYQDVFSKVGALSSAFGVCLDDLVDFIEQHPKHKPIRFWLDLGSSEGMEMEYDVNQEPVIRALIEAGWKKDKEVKFTLYEGARHHERYWRERFNEVLLFLFK